MRAAIVGTGWYVPEKVIPNSAFAGKTWYHYDGEGKRKIDPTTDQPKEGEVLTGESIVKKCGIYERRQVAKDEFVEDMVAQAAHKALDQAKLSVDKLDGIIMASVTGKKYPDAAALVKEKLGAHNAHETYVIQRACAGFPTALNSARLYAESEGKTMLVVGAEILTRVTDYRNWDINAILFGDGAGVAIVRPMLGSRGVIAYVAGCEPEESKYTFITQDPQGLLRMPEGGKVLEVAAESMANMTRELCKKTGWSLDEIDFLNLHQANARITRRVIKDLGIDPSKVGDNIALYGNMSAATCAIQMAKEREEGSRLGPGAKQILVAVGSGLTMSGVAIQH